MKAALILVLALAAMSVAAAAGGGGAAGSATDDWDDNTHADHTQLSFYESVDELTHPAPDNRAYEYGLDDDELEREAAGEWVPDGLEPGEVPPPETEHVHPHAEETRQSIVNDPEHPIHGGSFKREPEWDATPHAPLPDSPNTFPAGSHVHEYVVGEAVHSRRKNEPRESVSVSSLLDHSELITSRAIDTANQLSASEQEHVTDNRPHTFVDAPHPKPHRYSLHEHEIRALHETESPHVVDHHTIAHHRTHTSANGVEHHFDAADDHDWKDDTEYHHYADEQQLFAARAPAKPASTPAATVPAAGWEYDLTNELPHQHHTHDDAADDQLAGSAAEIADELSHPKPECAAEHFPGTSVVCSGAEWKSDLTRTMQAMNCPFGDATASTTGPTSYGCIVDYAECDKQFGFGVAASAEAFTSYVTPLPANANAPAADASTFRCAAARTAAPTGPNSLHVCDATNVVVDFGRWREPASIVARCSAVTLPPAVNARADTSVSWHSLVAGGRLACATEPTDERLKCVDTVARTVIVVSRTDPTRLEESELDLGRMLLAVISAGGIDLNAPDIRSQLAVMIIDSFPDGPFASTLFGGLTDYPIIHASALKAKTCFRRLIFAYPAQSSALGTSLIRRWQACPPAPPPPLPAGLDDSGVSRHVADSLASVAFTTAALSAPAMPPLAAGAPPRASFMLALRRFVLRSLPTSAKTLDLSWRAHPEYVLPPSVASMYAPMDAQPFHPLKIVLLSTQLAAASGSGGVTVLSNEEQLMHSISRHWGPLIEAQHVIVDHLSLPEQIALMRQTHILIGVSSSGAPASAVVKGRGISSLASLALFLRAQSVVIELDRSRAQFVPTAQTFATAVNANLLRWINTHSDHQTRLGGGESTVDDDSASVSLKVCVSEFVGVIQIALERLLNQQHTTTSGHTVTRGDAPHHM